MNIQYNIDVNSFYLHLGMTGMFSQVNINSDSLQFRILYVLYVKINTLYFKWTWLMSKVSDSVIKVFWWTWKHRLIIFFKVSELILMVENKNFCLNTYSKLEWHNSCDKVTDWLSQEYLWLKRIGQWIVIHFLRYSAIGH